MKGNTKRNTNRRTVNKLEGRPHPYSAAFQLWLRKNMNDFSELTWDALGSTYKRAKENGAI